MSQYLKNAILEYSFPGTGATVKLSLYQDDVFVRDLKTGIATIDGNTETVQLNTETGDDAAHTDYIDAGSGYEIRVINEGDATDFGILPESPFTIFDENDSDFPSINWNGDGFLFAANGGVYSDSAQTQVSALADSDAANGVVGSVAVRLPSNINTAYTLTQDTTASKPQYRYDQTANRPYIQIESGKSLSLSIPNDIPNPGYIEIILTTKGVDSDASSHIIELFGSDMLRLQGNGNSFVIVRIIGGQSGNNLDDNYIGHNVWRLKISKNAAFGPTELYVNDSVVHSVNLYRDTLPAGDYPVIASNGTSTRGQLFSLQLHVGELIGQELIDVVDAHKQFAGITS